MSSEDVHVDDAAMMEWYDPGPPELRPETREVLEKYSKVPPDQVIPHVTAIREKAWAIRNYPCIGEWRFLDMFIANHPAYPEIIERMKTGSQNFLDLGCAFAQDIRRLVADGIDSSKCYGADLRLDFLDLGYELFNDKETLKAKFIAADIFDEDSDLKELDGNIDIIEASSFFHLFGWEEQKAVARRVAKLMKPQRGSLLVGRQVGNPQSGETPTRLGGKRFQQNLESWKKMWEEIGDEIGVKFEVEGSTEFREIKGRSDMLLKFTVRRAE